MRATAKALVPHAATVLAAVLAVVLVGQFGAYDRFIVGQLAVLIIASLGLSILIGAAGQLSLASAAFLGVGSYGVLVLLAHGWPFWVACLGVLLLTWLLGSVLGLVSLRLEGFYLAIVTFGFLGVFDVLIENGGTLTGGALGLTAPDISVLGVPLTSDNAAKAAVFVAVLTAVCSRALMRSRVGRAMRLVKVDSRLAAITGVRTAWTKTSAFALSAVLAALAGILQAFLLGSASPATYSVTTSIQDLTVVVIAGLAGSALGTVVSAVVLFEVPYLIPALGTYSDYFYGGMLLVMLAAFPAGLDGLIRAAHRRLRRKVVA